MPQGLGELLRSSNNNIRSENITIIEKMLGSVQNVLNAVANSLQTPISRREAGYISGGTLAGLTFTGGLAQILLNGCVSSDSAQPFDMSQPIDPSKIVHYPKLPGKKIQSPEHYGLEGCMTGVLGAAYTINLYDELVGKKPTIICMRTGLGKHSIAYGLSKSELKNIKDIMKFGSIPLISYDARIGDLPKYQKLFLKDLSEGKHSKIITKTAKDLRKVGDEYGGFFIRTLREMTLISWPWGGNSKQFKKIWDHIWNIFEQEGTNEYATWVWNPFVGPSRNGTNIGKRYYPDEQHVDWIGMNAYNPVANTGFSKNFSQLFNSAYKNFRKSYKEKPLMVAETGCPEMKNKPYWVEKAFHDTKYKFPGIKALCWWDEKWKSRGTNMDTRINSSEKSFNAFKEGIKDKYFLENIHKTK